MPLMWLKATHVALGCLCTLAAVPCDGALVAAAAASVVAPDGECQAGASGSAERGDCVLSALQLESKRQRSAPSGRAGPVQQLESGSTAKEQLGPWAHSGAEMLRLVHSSRLQGLLGGLNMTMDTAAELIAPFAAHSRFCPSYVAYSWPMLSFWAREAVRRLGMAPSWNRFAVMQARSFARKASFLASILKFDPRRGAEWADQVAAYMKIVAFSDSLDMPILPTFFRRTSIMDQTFASEATMWWTENMFCDIEWWRKSLLGAKAAGRDVCWDTVEHPGFGFSQLGVSLVKGLRASPLSFDLSNPNYPEYLSCQEHGLDQSTLTSICPFGGHLEEGTWGENWGTGVPTEEGRREVLECQAKMGPEQYRSFEGDKVHWPFDMEVRLGPILPDGKPDLGAPWSDKDARNPEAFVQEMQELLALRSTAQLQSLVKDYFDAHPEGRARFEQDVRKVMAQLKQSATDAEVTK